MKFISYSIAAFISVISAYVSFTVFYSLSAVYGLIAVGFEAAKPLLFHKSASFAKLGDTNKSVFFGIVALSLSAFSVVASVSMLENSVNTLKTESSQYQITLKQIERLEMQASSQRKANYVTAASNTENKISDLMATLPALKSDNVLSQYGKQISISVSVMCELIVFSVIFSCANNVVQSKTVHIENMTNNIQVNALIHVRESIIRGETKPSFRGVAEKFKGLRREDVRAMFEEMKQDGILAPFGNNGYKLVRYL